MRKKRTDGMIVQEIMKECGCSRATAFRAKKRGYICPAYHEKKFFPLNDGEKIDAEEIIRIARIVYFRRFSLCFYQHKEDLIQEAILRLLEVSGNSQFPEFKFKFGVARNAMRDYIRKFEKGGKKADFTLIDRGEKSGEVVWA